MSGVPKERDFFDVIEDIRSDIAGPPLTWAVGDRCELDGYRGRVEVVLRRRGAEAYGYVRLAKGRLVGAPLSKLQLPRMER